MVKGEQKFESYRTLTFSRFLYADQRLADGKMAGQTVNGPAHADFFAQLAASGAENVPWHATFVKDQGYAKF